MDKKKKNITINEYPEFFDVFLPKCNSKRMHIPSTFVKCLQGRVLKKAILKSPKGKVWYVSVNNIKGDMYFDNGWKKFTKENSLEVGFFITFAFDGNKTFNFKIYKRNRCEKEDETEPEEEESDSSIEVIEEEDDDEDYEDDDTEVEKEKEELVKKISDGKKRKGSISNARAKRAMKIEDCEFDFEAYVQPNNPYYFLTKIGGNRRNELHIPSSMINDHSLKLQEQQQITIRRCCKRLPEHEVESQHHHQRGNDGVEERKEKREWKGEVIKSKVDGRFCIRRWGAFCRGNGISQVKNDVCLCEFLVDMGPQDGQTNTLLVHIIRDHDSKILMPCNV